jgi:hypothetical protein
MKRVKNGQKHISHGTEGIAGMFLISFTGGKLTPAGILTRTALISLLRENSISSTRKRARKRRGRGTSSRGRSS